MAGRSTRSLVRTMDLEISAEVQALLHRTAVAARQANRAEITLEHLASELLAEPDFVSYLEGCRTNITAWRSGIDQRLAKVREVDPNALETKPSREFEQVIQGAFSDARKQRRPAILVSDIFLSLLDQRGSLTTAQLLEATDDPAQFEELRRNRSGGAV